MAKGVSLHIGLNSVDPDHYGGWSGPLMACEADANDMMAIATERQFTPTKLLTSQATRDATISGIEVAARELSAGDIFFLSYSGHGGQVPDMGNDEADLQDETWCLYDGQLIDDELGELWPHFEAGVRIFVLSDSCHSGSAIRAAYNALAAAGVGAGTVSRAAQGEPVYRAMPDDAAFETFFRNSDFYREIAGKLPAEPSPIQAAVRLISGCQDNQLSLDGTFNGLFTGTLKRVWANGAFDENYARFHAEILRRMPPTQSPNHYVIGVVNPNFDAETPFSI